VGKLIVVVVLLMVVAWLIGGLMRGRTGR